MDDINNYLYYTGFNLCDGVYKTEKVLRIMQPQEISTEALQLFTGDEALTSSPF